jgi:hypothetical protein
VNSAMLLGEVQGKLCYHVLVDTASMGRLPRQAAEATESDDHVIAVMKTGDGVASAAEDEVEQEIGASGQHADDDVPRRAHRDRSQSRGIDPQRYHVDTATLLRCKVPESKEKSLRVCSCSCSFLTALEFNVSEHACPLHQQERCQALAGDRDGYPHARSLTLHFFPS